jgi:DNA-binding NarL/FixJ family response regulator
MSSSNSVPIRVFIIENHSIVLWGLEKLIASAKHPMKVIGRATSCVEGLKLIQKLTADVILLDIDSDIDNGLKEIPELIAGTKARFLVFTGTRNKALYEKVVLLGAMGVVDKETPVEKILTAIVKVHEGEIWLDRTVTGRVFVALSRKEGIATDAKGENHAKLTKREQEIVEHVAAHTEASARNIAKMLYISEHTLRNHLTSIYDKLEVTNRMELFVYAQKHGIAKTITFDKQ